MLFNLGPNRSFIAALGQDSVGAGKRCRKPASRLVAPVDEMLSGDRVHDRPLCPTLVPATNQAGPGHFAFDVAAPYGGRQTASRTRCHSFPSFVPQVILLASGYP